MKKNRIGIKIAALCDKNDIDKLSKILFEETTTLGIRIFPAGRKKLDREIKTIQTKYGKIRIKISKLNNTHKNQRFLGPRKSKRFSRKIKNITPEYEDCVRIARKYKIPLRKVYEEVRNIYK